MTDEENDTEEAEEQERESEERRRRRKTEDTESGTKKSKRKDEEHRAESKHDDKEELEDEADLELQSEIPQIGLEEETSETKDLDTSTGELTNQETEVPQPDLLYESVEVRELHDEIEEKTDSGIGVPQIELESDTWGDVVNFDTSLILQEDDGIEIPQVRTKSAKIPKSIELSTELEDWVGKSDETEKHKITDKESDEHAIGQQIGSAAAADGSFSGVGELPPHDPFELLFMAQGEGYISSDEPIVIWLDEDEDENSLRTLEWLCSQIYREKTQSRNPDFRRITDLEELNQEAGKSWIELAENKLFTVELTEDEYEKVDTDRIETRLEELAFQGFGFLIFDTSFDEVLHEIDMNKHPINHVRINAGRPSSERLADIQKLCTGFIELSLPSTNTATDELFNRAKLEYESRLEKSAKSEGGIFWDTAEPDETGESREHRYLKAIVTKLLVEELREDGQELENSPQIMEYIVSEEDLGNAVPDIYYEDEGVVFEIETLFSEETGGKSPRDKLRKSFKKYEEIGIEEVNIVLENMAFLRHLDQIVELQRNWGNWEKIDFEFYTINLENESLVPTEEIVQKLKELRIE